MRRLIVLTVLCLLAACAQAGDTGATKEGPTITVGSADFTESIVLAEIYAQGLAAKGYKTDTKLRIGSREVYFPALTKGEVDLFPEYIGSLLSYVTKQKKTADPESEKTYVALTKELEGKGVQLLSMSDAQDKDGIVVNEQTADEHSLTKISDLVPVASRLVMGGPPECPQRQACLKGLEDVYEIEFKEFKPLDAGGPQTITALKENQVQVANLFTTDSRISANGFVLLEDDKGPIAGAENVAPVVADEVIDEYGADLTAAIDAITGTFTTEGLLEMNSRVDNDKDDAEDVAADWLEEHDLA